MFKKILLGLLLIVMILAVVIALQPTDFKITRSITINAPPATVFPLVNDFHQWAQWSPWEKMDPAMQKTFEGPESGVGAVYRWEGNSDVGVGSMTITESKPLELLLIRLEFTRPMESVAQTEFTFKPDGDGTAITWTMTGNNNFMGKAFSLFMNMDKMIGTDFEQGLTELRKVAEDLSRQ